MLSAIQCTRGYLSKIQSTLLRSPPPDELQLGILTTTLGMLEEDWKTLHQFIKPVTDADLLHLPVPLVDLLNHQASRISVLDGCRAVVSHGGSLGYFKRAHVSIQQAIDSLSWLCTPTGTEGLQFPKGLGVIVLPFTSANQLFQNSILYHELGEFVYDESNVASELKSKLKSLETETSQVGKSLQPLDLIEKRRVVSWCRELFCDLFAAHVIGPVFSFALAEYLELANAKENHWESTHPPDDIRFDEQIAIYKSDGCGWWKHLLLQHADACSFLEGFRASGKKERLDWERSTTADGGNGESEPSAKCDRYRLLVGILNSLKPFVRELARNRSDHIQSQAPSTQLWERILECLEHGIVPSALLLNDGDEIVRPVTLVNAGYFFGREKLDDLFRHVPSRNSANLADRAWLLSRVEDWTLKAIDDLLNWSEASPSIEQSSGAETEPTGGVLPWKPIRRAWKQRHPAKIDSVVVTPVNWDGIDVDAIDLRLGPRFVLSRPHSIASVDFRIPRDSQTADTLELLRAQEVVHLPKGATVVIPPHGTILGATLEFLKLPNNACGQVLTKSSLARRFVTIATAPWIHPLYRGCLTLEIANASSVALRLRVGDAIAQLVLFSIASADSPQQDTIDEYAGPTYPELDPGEDS